MSNLIYLFEITFQDGKKYYLTSAANDIVQDDIIYMANSGLNIIHGEFNDSAQDYVLIHGIFEKGGITQKDDLTDALVNIKRLTLDSMQQIALLICTKYISYDLEFQIKCEPETIKYNQSLVQTFSKKCRTNFGDNRCKISLEDLTITSTILEYTKNTLTCDFGHFSNSYFQGGKIIISDLANKVIFEFKIISHFGNKLEVDLSNEFDWSSYRQIKICPNCDKNYRTCCYSFNNAVNFRGEPAIPEYNLIQN